MISFLPGLINADLQIIAVCIGVAIMVLSIALGVLRALKDRGFDTPLMSSYTQYVPILDICKSAGIDVFDVSTPNSNRVLDFAQSLTQACASRKIRIEGREVADRKEIPLAITHHALMPIPIDHLSKNTVDLWHGKNADTESDYIKRVKPFYIDLHVHRGDALRWLKRWRKANRQA